jgi:hypothetical protein
MAMRVPFEPNANRYMRHLWNKETYLYLAEFFRTAYFAAGKSPTETSATDPNIDPSIDGYRNSGPDGGWALPCGVGGSAGSYEYTSYFKVYDASSGSVCKYGVYDGHLKNESGECGEAYVNGVKIDVPVFKSAEITAEGIYSVYLRGYIASAGANAEVLSSSTPSGFAYQERLLGRVTVKYVGDKYVITNINQDYLVGGEIVFILFKECGTAWD